MSRGARALAALGVILVSLGVAAAALLHDRFLGIALFIAGAFLIVLPLSRPSLDED